MQAVDGFDIVLCRAREAGNVGAVCRAMKTMGFRRLVLANCGEYPMEPIKTLALHAFDIYEAARRFPDLRSALEGYSLAAGFTRRMGKLRTQAPLDVREFGPYALGRAGKTALVFGNESDGLSRAELALCDIAVRIPTSEDYPSLNLAQAVQIACWEVAGGHKPVPRRGLEPGATENGTPPEGRADIARTVREIAEDLTALGFFKIAGRPEMERFLGSLLARAAPDSRELERFRSLFRKATALSERKGREALTPAPSGARVSDKMSVNDAPKGDGHATT